MSLLFIVKAIRSAMITVQLMWKYSVNFFTTHEVAAQSGRNTASAFAPVVMLEKVAQRAS